jgi:hypothetical protein
LFFSQDELSDITDSQEESEKDDFETKTLEEVRNERIQRLCRNFRIPTTYATRIDKIVHKAEYANEE